MKHWQKYTVAALTIAVSAFFISLREGPNERFHRVQLMIDDVYDPVIQRYLSLTAEQRGAITERNGVPASRLGTEFSRHTFFIRDFPPSADRRGPVCYIWPIDQEGLLPNTIIVGWPDQGSVSLDLDDTRQMYPSFESRSTPAPTRFAN